MNRILIVDPERCDGCEKCVSACRTRRDSSAESDVACVTVIPIPEESSWLPLLCRQCEHPPCVLTCPTGALTRASTAVAVMLDSDKCVGCGICLVSCPLGGIHLNAKSRKAAKCDLCWGEPACVKSCRPGALLLSEPHHLGKARRLRSGAMIQRLVAG